MSTAIGAVLSSATNVNGSVVSAAMGGTLSDWKDFEYSDERDFEFIDVRNCK